MERDQNTTNHHNYKLFVGKTKWNLKTPHKQSQYSGRQHHTIPYQRYGINGNELSQNGCKSKNENNPMKVEYAFEFIAWHIVKSLWKRFQK